MVKALEVSYSQHTGRIAIDSLVRRRKLLRFRCTCLHTEVPVLFFEVLYVEFVKHLLKKILLSVWSRS